MNRRLFLSFSALAALLLASSEVSLSSPAPHPEKHPKPLMGYTVITVEKFTVGSFSAKEGFPQDFEKVMQKTAVEKLTASKFFEKVLDAAEPTSDATTAATTSEEARRLILSGTVIGYDPGNQTTRALLCCGAGATKVKVRFIFRDAQTNKEVFRTDQQDKYSGNWALTGGTTEKATRRSAEKVV